MTLFHPPGGVRPAQAGAVMDFNETFISRGRTIRTLLERLEAEGNARALKLTRSPVAWCILCFSDLLQAAESIA
jgi:hypothetical protein